MPSNCTPYPKIWTSRWWLRWAGRSPRWMRPPMVAPIASGCRKDRQRQIDLVQDVGQALARLVHQPFVSTALGLMRNPAKLAGLSALQDFLQRGYEAFRKIADLQGFPRRSSAENKSFLKHYLRRMTAYWAHKRAPGVPIGTGPNLIWIHGVSTRHDKNLQRCVEFQTGPCKDRSCHSFWEPCCDVSPPLQQPSC